MKTRVIAYNDDGSVKHVLEHEIKSLDSKVLRDDIASQADLTEYINPNQGKWKIIMLQIQE